MNPIPLGVDGGLGCPVPLTPVENVKSEGQTKRAAELQTVRFRAHGKYTFIFITKHYIEWASTVHIDELCDVLRYGDNSQLSTPGVEHKN